MREFSRFHYKEINIRCSSPFLEAIKGQIKKDRKDLEAYIALRKEFQSSFQSIPLDENAPPAARSMLQAAEITGLGPMASVAGCLAQRAVESALSDSQEECILENGGDLYMRLRQQALLGIYAGDSPLSGKLAFQIQAEDTPLGVCSSSRMGNSISLGKADLVTVFSINGALADSAATLGGNLVQEAKDLQPTAERLSSIAGIQGCLIILGDQLAMAGRIPPLVKIRGNLKDKITHSPEWIF